MLVKDYRGRNAEQEIWKFGRTTMMAHAVNVRLAVQGEEPSRFINGARR
jgi:hypothetical protein